MSSYEGNALSDLKNLKIRLEPTDSNTYSRYLRVVEPEINQHYKPLLKTAHPDRHWPKRDGANAGGKSSRANLERAASPSDGLATHSCRVRAT
jgi:hypothetical protein